MKERGFTMFPYLDDHIVVSERHQAEQAFTTLHCLIEELGLLVNKDKYVPPLRSLMR